MGKEIKEVLTCKQDFMDLFGVGEHKFNQLYAGGYVKCKRVGNRYFGSRTAALDHFIRKMGSQENQSI